jgi:phenylalanyl-tRNA synthetase alpha subunit
VLVLDLNTVIDPWVFMGQTLQIVSELLPGRSITIDEFTFPACSKMWEVSVDRDGKPIGVLAWGVYTPEVVRLLGGDPAIHTAFGLGFGLERMAAIHFGYDDIRKLASERLDGAV